MKNPVVVNIIKEVVEKVSAERTPDLVKINNQIVGIRYSYGHPVDLVNELAQLSKTEKNRYTKYPFIGIFLDIPQTRGAGNSFKVKLNGFIANATNKDYTPIQRTQISFVPILHPIYDEFIEQLLKHPVIVTPEKRIIPHIYIERYQWGKGGLEFYDNGKKNMFGDFIDAIEFRDMELEFKLNC